MVLYEDFVCDVRVLKNARNEIIWPQKTARQICAEQDAEPEDENKCPSQNPVRNPE
jgi:hypothetical protein